MTEINKKFAERDVSHLLAEVRNAGGDSGELGRGGRDRDRERRGRALGLGLGEGDRRRDGDGDGGLPPFNSTLLGSQDPETFLGVPSFRAVDLRILGCPHSCDLVARCG